MTDVAIVRWADAHCGPSGWIDLDEYKDDGEEIVVTVGFIAPEGTKGYKPKHVTIWQTLSSDDGIHPFHIPVDMVRTITILCTLDVGLE